jgi:hypothetical protein
MARHLPLDWHALWPLLARQVYAASTADSVALARSALRRLHGLPDALLHNSQQQSPQQSHHARHLARMHARVRSFTIPCNNSVLA